MALAVRTLENFVGGTWVAATGDSARTIVSPVTGETLAEAPDASPADVDAAVEAAGRAQPMWAARSAWERAEICHAIADLIAERREDFARELTLEQGKPYASEALGFRFERDMDIVRDGQLEATNYFFSLGDHASVLELTFNHDGRTYDLGTGYGHIAIGVDDLDATLAELKQQGIEPERPPYTVSDGGSRLCFVRDPDDYRIEIIERD